MDTDTPHLLPRRVTVLTKFGKLEDIISRIVEADAKAEQYVSDLVDKWRSLDTVDQCREIWNYWKSTIPYQEDTPGHQVIQSPGELYRNRYRTLRGTGTGGDCKSLSLACAGCLQALGIPYQYRFIAESGKDQLHHVYIVTDSGIILDCVYDIFNAEVRHVKELNVRPDGIVSESIGIDELKTEGTMLQITDQTAISGLEESSNLTPILIILMILLGYIFIIKPAMSDKAETE